MEVFQICGNVQNYLHICCQPTSLNPFLPMAHTSHRTHSQGSGQCSCAPVRAQVCVLPAVSSFFQSYMFGIIRGNVCMHLVTTGVFPAG